MNAQNNGDLARTPNTALAKRAGPLEFLVTPIADIFETPDAFTIKLDMPGATKDSISVTVQSGCLAVRGGVPPHGQEGALLLSSEIGRKSYLREFNLGDGVNHDDIQALFEEGVLTVTVPKTDEIKPREIQIK